MNNRTTEDFFASIDSYIDKYKASTNPNVKSLLSELQNKSTKLKYSIELLEQLIKAPSVSSEPESTTLSKDKSDKIVSKKIFKNTLTSGGIALALSFIVLSVGMGGSNIELWSNTVPLISLGVSLAPATVISAVSYPINKTFYNREKNRAKLINKRHSNERKKEIETIRTLVQLNPDDIFYSKDIPNLEKLPLELRKVLKETILNIHKLRDSLVSDISLFKQINGNQRNISAVPTTGHKNIEKILIDYQNSETYPHILQAINEAKKCNAIDELDKFFELVTDGKSNIVEVKNTFESISRKISSEPNNSKILEKMVTVLYKEYQKKASLSPKSPPRKS